LRNNRLIIENRGFLPANWLLRRCRCSFVSRGTTWGINCDFRNFRQNWGSLWLGFFRCSGFWGLDRLLN
jgi:hypothetical protein